MQLADATVLITGATGGIGQATARELRACGSRLVLTGRNEQRLVGLSRELGACSVRADLATAEGVPTIVEAAAGVDVVVHCAGIGMRGPLEEASDEQRAQLVAVNLTAPMSITAAVLPHMRARGRGHIAFVGSIAGLTGVRNEAVYAATKAGLLAFAASVRAELEDSGVTVSTISPAAVDTGFWAARGAEYHRQTPRLIAAERVARELIHGMQSGGSDRVEPRWLAVAPAVRSITPRGYDALARRLDRD